MSRLGEMGKQAAEALPRLKEVAEKDAVDRVRKAAPEAAKRVEEAQGRPF